VRSIRRIVPDRPFRSRTTPGAVHCYEGLRLQTSAEAIAGVVLVEVFSSGGADPADRLRIERRLHLGSCPVTPAPSDFTTNAMTFQR
jgi:hypothetical protein